MISDGNASFEIWLKHISGWYIMAKDWTKDILNFLYRWRDYGYFMRNIMN